MRLVAIVLINSFALSAIAAAQSRQIDPGAFLKAITVQINLTAVATNNSRLCHGFVGNVDRGANTAYIVTAKHCVQELVVGDRLMGRNNFANLEDLKISAEVSFPDGLSGTVHEVMWSSADDVVILYADYPPASTAQSYQQICKPKCGYYTLQFFWPANIPIYSILSAQGTNPIISTGRLLVDVFSRLTVVLTTAPGTSGAPVIDGGGALVGILNAGNTNVANGTAPVVKLVPGRAIERLLGSAVAYSRPSKATSSLPTPSPGVTTPIPATPSGPAQSTAAPLPPPPPVTSDPFLILPGQSVGPVSLGMEIQDGIARLGPSKGVTQMEDGTIMYRWFEPPSNSGIGVRTAQNGTVLRVWILNDERYRTKEGLRVGSTEAEVRAALGKPTRVEVRAQGKTRTLIYESLGLWFSVQRDQQYSFYNTVFDIGVQQPK